MNESADPCTDFHAYVCGGRDGDRDAESTIGTLERAYRRDVVEALGNVTPSPSRCRASPHIHVARRRLSRTLVCCSVVASAVAVAALSLLVIRHGAIRAPPSLCETGDCVRHAQSILATMNESADPCTDFHAYVCGGRDGDRDAESTIGTLERAYRRDVVEALGNVTAFLTAREIPTAAIKAFTAVADCLSGRDEATTQNFTEFMRARGVPWPHQPNASVIERGALGVLGVLLDLAINWGVGLWFEVTLSQEISPYSVPLVIIRESGQLPLQRMEQLAGLDEFAYQALIQNMSLQLSEREVTLHDAAVAELRADENSFKRILADGKGEDAGERFDTMMRVGDLATVFGGAVSPLELTALLVKHFSDTVSNFSADTRVLVLNRKQFGQIGSLVGSLPPRRLLNVIGWTFAYSYAWIANVDVLSAPPHDELYVYARCFVAAQESFGIVQAAPIFRAALNAQERQRVVEILECTSTTLASIIKKSPRPAESTKKEAIAKVGSLSSRWLWPPVRYLYGPSLDLLYSSFPDGGNTFFETWMLSKVALRAAFNSSYYGSIMTSRYRWRSGGVLYLYALNELCLSLSAVFPPSYLQGGSTAMSYAGLGFQLARQIVRSVDLRGRALDRTGHSKCWWKLSKRGERPCRLDRAKSAKERLLVADLFALDVALEAMRASLLQDPTEPPLRLKSLERLTEVQTFYVSYCSHFCGEPRGLVMCNLARNGSEFGSAFGCRPRPQTGPTCLFV
ncbi:neprilysin-1-like [Dermacentor silvarum]|uniref:neprilysin-1-like n=1 Tax=Dermacentor silvarum TaxID=543639 RepID=UPI00210117F8|nr:neprilysin-1-like [Dermacentor silvarum]